MSGYYDAIIYVILASIAFVFLDNLCRDVDPISALFVMSGVAIFCFNVLSCRSLNKVYRSLFNNPFLFLAMSSALAVDWFCMIYATYLSDPFVTMTSLFICSGFLGFVQLYRETGSRPYLFSMFLLILSILVLYFKYEIQKPGSISYGILLGALAGLAFFIYMVTSEALCDRSGMSSLQILATRFWVLFIGSAILLPPGSLNPAIAHNAYSLIVVSIGSLVVPIFFNQQAIKKLGVAKASVLASLVPATTYFIYAMWNKNILLTNALLCFIITLSLILPKFLKIRSV
ncbi:MAG: hypothetical protein Q8R24_10270 [Legionellaceae bacterium]|nr:hypothetical protein [Legionellaceae bacterium]